MLEEMQALKDGLVDYYAKIDRKLQDLVRKCRLGLSSSDREDLISNLTRGIRTEISRLQSMEYMYHKGIRQGKEDSNGDK